jgi:hypothetical protein
MDDGNGGTFVDLFGALTNTLIGSYIETGVTQGSTYAFRYRGMNIYGWGSWSPITYILAATVPSQPSAPTFVSATDS